MSLRQENLKVLKFGGTSVGSPEALRRAARIVAGELPRGGLVVVSALSGTTDQLGRAVEAAGRGDRDGAREILEALVGRHCEVASTLGLLEAVESGWRPLFQRLGGLLEGIGLLWEATPRARDAALAMGEDLSARLFAALLATQGIPARFREVRELLRTDDRHGQARVDLRAIHAGAKAWRDELLSGAWLVTQGFVGATAEGHTTTLGRGGSDTSATLLGEALRAAEVQIWTDVDGVLSADPSLVPRARPIPEMSVAEAASLSGFGAKVLHAACLAPVARAGFRLCVANTLRPEASRTHIRREAPPRSPGQVSSVAYKEGITLLRFAAHTPIEEWLPLVQGLESAGAVRYGLLSSPEGSLVALRVESAAARERLERLDSRICIRETGWAVVALVGEGLRADPQAAHRLLGLLEGQALGGVLTGSSAVSVAFLVPEADLPTLVPRLWARCFEEDAAQTLDLHLVGVGTVGKALLGQLQRLRERAPGRAERLRLRSLSNSRRTLHLDESPHGLDPGELLERLERAGAPASLEGLRAHPGENPVLVDCSGSAQVSGAYLDFARSGFHLVAAGKQGRSGPGGELRELDRELGTRGRQYRYETNVGAGLPILGTIRDLRDGGDRIHRLTGILSGSLSWIFGALEEGLPFSEAVRRARELGLTEPDPRDDLSGLDLARKALILHRELGGSLELEQVQVEGVLPADFGGGDLEGFLARLPLLDGAFRSRVETLAQTGRVLRYGVEVDGERCRVGLLEVAAGDPLADIREGENALCIHSEAYCPRPLVVRGYGAGATVTAAGVLADVLKLAGSAL